MSGSSGSRASERGVVRAVQLNLRVKRVHVRARLVDRHEEVFVVLAIHRARRRPLRPLRRGLASDDSRRRGTRIGISPRRCGACIWRRPPPDAPVALDGPEHAPFASSRAALTRDHPPAVRRFRAFGVAGARRRDRLGFGVHEVD